MLVTLTKEKFKFIIGFSSILLLGVQPDAWSAINLEFTIKRNWN